MKVNPALLIGGAAVLLLASSSNRSVGISGRASRPCPPLSPGGGHMAGYDYIEFATGGASLRDRLPIIFYFHSLGTNPTGLAKNLKGIGSRARVVMPYGHESYGSGPSWWKLRAATKDQSGLAEQMDSERMDMLEFIDEANRCLLVVGKPIITGHSQGGMMTFALASAAPGRFKVAIPVAGWLPFDLWPRSLPQTHAVHGTKDKTVDYDRTADFVAQATSGGLPIEFYPIKGSGHGLGGSMKSTWVDLVDSMV